MPLTTATASTTPSAAGSLAPAASARLSAGIALMLGMLVVGVSGFSHIDAIHNAAHDTRHSNAFPCH